MLTLFVKESQVGKRLRLDLVYMCIICFCCIYTNTIYLVSTSEAAPISQI